MKLVRNQRGLTLVELLGAMTLVFVIAGLVFATLTNSLQIFQGQSDQINVRQEVNIIANQLTTFYQQNGEFEVIPEGDGVIIISGGETREFSIPGHEIRIDVSEPWEQSGRFDKKEIEISVNGNEEFTLYTTVSRLSEDK